MRAKCVLQWQTTSFETKRHQAAEGAARFDQAWSLADQLGLVVPISTIKPQLDGPNAADHYEQMLPVIESISAKQWQELNLMARVANWPPHYKALLEKLGPLICIAAEAASIERCQTDAKYITQPGEVQPMFSAMKALLAIQLELRRPDLQGDHDRQIQLYRVMTSILRHLAQEPSQASMTVCLAASVKWFQISSMLLNISPETRTAVSDSLELLAPVRTFRSTLIAEVLRSSYVRGFGPRIADGLDKFRMPTSMIEEIRRIEDYPPFVAAWDIQTYCNLVKLLPADEASDGPRSREAYWTCVRRILDSRQVLSVPMKWGYLALPEPSAVKPLFIWQNMGAAAAKVNLHRIVVQLALEVYDRQRALGRFPVEIKLPLDPVTHQPLFYRGHPDWFCITGKTCDFQSGSKASF